MVARKRGAVGAVTPGVCGLSHAMTASPARTASNAAKVDRVRLISHLGGASVARGRWVLVRGMEPRTGRTAVAGLAAVAATLWIPTDAGSGTAQDKKSE